MSTPTDADRHAEQVRQITEDLLQQAQPILDDIARTLADTPDEQLFGDTEFILREKALKLVAAALNSRIAQKTRSRWLNSSATKAAGFLVSHVEWTAGVRPLVWLGSPTLRPLQNNSASPRK